MIEKISTIPINPKMTNNFDPVHCIETGKQYFIEYIYIYTGNNDPWFTRKDRREDGRKNFHDFH